MFKFELKKYILKPSVAVFILLFLILNICKAFEIYFYFGGGRAVVSGETTISEAQKEIYEKYGTHFIHASDEWYILAEREFPEEERYDGYIQLENGVGMMRLLMNEFEEAYGEIERAVNFVKNTF